MIFFFFIMQRNLCCWRHEYGDQSDLTTSLSLTSLPVSPCCPGFRMLEAFNLTEKTYSSIRGVSMEPGSFNSYTAYRLHKNAFLSQPST